MLLIQQDSVEEDGYRVALRMESTEEEYALEVTLVEVLPRSVGEEQFTRTFDPRLVFAHRHVPTQQNVLERYLRSHTGISYRKLNRLAWKMFEKFKENDRLIRGTESTAPYGGS